MKVKKNARILLHYRMRTEDGQEVDRTPEGEPLTFVCGRQEVVPGFERELMGLEPGQTKTFWVEPADAYGARDESRVLELPRAGFPADAKLELGARFSYRSPRGAEMYTIREVRDDTIVVDSNHPLAGTRLVYDVEILAVEEDTIDTKI